MENRLLLSFLFFLLNISVNAQDITFSKDIYPILSKNCIKCHNKKDGVGPFPLETYDDIVKNITLIKYVIENGIMPPWKADTIYRHYKNERILSNSEIDKISSWISSKYQMGERINKINVINGATDLGKPDLVIKPKKPYILKPINEDDFITYIIPVDFGKDKYLRAIEIVPQNKRVVHHCRVDFELTDKYNHLLNSDGYVSTKDLQAIPFPTLKFIGDYVPGISAYKYPQNMGVRLSRKMYMMINIHYSPVTKYEKDQTEVHLFFYKQDTVERDVINQSISLEKNTDAIRKYKIPADSLYTISMTSIPIEYDISIFSIQPHMHLFGKSIKVIAITPSKDSIKLINITKWDFNWQEVYYFNTLIKIPKGSIFYAEAVYDNTVNNPKNPFIPPKTIYFNDEMKSTNEMFEFYLQYVKYKNNDENVRY